MVSCATCLPATFRALASGQRVYAGLYCRPSLFGLFNAVSQLYNLHFNCCIVLHVLQPLSAHLLVQDYVSGRLHYCLTDTASVVRTTFHSSAFGIRNVCVHNRPPLQINSIRLSVMVSAALASNTCERILRKVPTLNSFMAMCRLSGSYLTLALQLPYLPESSHELSYL